MYFILLDSLFIAIFNVFRWYTDEDEGDDNEDDEGRVINRVRV